MAFYSVFTIASLFWLGANGRAVNVSSAWFLPQEGFPVFYRYFSDKVTWNEAEAVCGFHHADLISVQTSAQMDAARAYLKEIDITDNIWIGLKKDSPEKSFQWTNGEKLLGDGYWVEPIPKTNEKLCAAIDPVSDFRWNSFYCRGPQVASFVCELPVPEWAKKEDGCMITSLPSLTVTLMPEVGVIQLFSDCGLDGTRRIACKGGVNREEIIRRLSCDVDAFASTTFSKSTTDTTKELNTPESIVNEESNSLQTAKTWETYTPLTRHRRNSGLSSLAEAFAQEQQIGTSKMEEVAIAEATSATKTDLSKAPTHNFPHSPFLESERNNGTTALTKTMTTQAAKIPSTETSQTTPKTVSSTTESAALPFVPPLKIANTNSSKSLIHKETNKTTPPVSPPNTDIPVLIITGEKLNETGNANLESFTSENPQIVFMINNKEGSEERFLIPLREDVLTNNASLPSVEVINVDVVEVENFTTKTVSVTPATIQREATQTQTTLPPPPPTFKVPEVNHPMKLREKKVEGVTTTTSVTPPKAPTTLISLKSTQIPKMSTESEVSSEELEGSKQDSLNIVGRDIKGENIEVPQRPNRGRLLTHSSHPSFYPYFLNRVLG